MSRSPGKVSPFGRKPPFRPTRESFLILCEGQSTEPHYFNAFKLSTATVRALPVTAGSAMAVVESAIKRRQAEDQKNKPYDHYWVVFDKDATPDEVFNQAIDLARASGFNVAYSNQAFEIWLLLHFDFVSGPLPRRQYAPRLSRLLGFAYSKQAQTAQQLFLALYERQELAIAHAEQLERQYERATGPGRRDPALEESSTTVHQLVKQLRSFR